MFGKIKYNHRISTIRPRRYKNLFEIIFKNQCQKILEIGTWNGKHAYQMIQTAKIFHSKEKIYYYGFDLFENFSNEDLKKEFSKKPPSQNYVNKKLERTGVNINLFKGYTRKTLPDFVNQVKEEAIKLDFIFIDGGHSINTINSDWKYIKEIINNKSIVIFDDYYRNDEENLKNYGSKLLIDSLNPNTYEIEILNPEDHFKKSWGVLNIRMVKVGLKMI